MHDGCAIACALVYRSVSSNIWLHEPGIILSLATPSNIHTEDPISHPRMLVQVSALARNYRRKRSFQFESNSRFEPFEFLNFQTPTTTVVDTIQYPLSFTALFPPASTHFCDSSFPISVSQNGIPNGIPLLVRNTLCPWDTYVSRNETHKVIVYCTFCIHQLRGFFSIGFSSRSTRFSKWSSPVFHLTVNTSLHNSTFRLITFFSFIGLVSDMFNNRIMLLMSTYSEMKIR